MSHYLVWDSVYSFDGVTVMKIPKLTSSQYLALSLLTEEELSGRNLRQKLSEHGQRSSAPAFYQFMARLEDAGYVKGRYQQKTIGGQAIKERVYTITGSGSGARREFLNFATSWSGVRFAGG
jgi:DNA-binding PadR family transcriptional regulator